MKPKTRENLFIQITNQQNGSLNNSLNKSDLDKSLRRISNKSFTESGNNTQTNPLKGILHKQSARNNANILANNSSKKSKGMNMTLTISYTKNSTQELNHSNVESKEERFNHTTDVTGITGFPISPAKALKHYFSQLTDYEKVEILDYKEVYFIGSNIKKISGNIQKDMNMGYDDERGDYNIVLHDHICYRYEILGFLGKGSFGQAIKCLDHKTKEVIALKIIRNKKKFQYQATVELKLLQYIVEKDVTDSSNAIKIKNHFTFRKHLCLTFEMLSINLYEFLGQNNFQGISLNLIRRFTIQVLQCLKFLSDHNIIHCDMKPENILLRKPDKSGIRVIDFGSGCFANERIYTYIQSRFYRAPEIILGIPYTAAIDMWSLGCILAELFRGYPIFPGEDEKEQLLLIMEIKGVPSAKLLKCGTRTSIFYDDTLKPILTPNSRGVKRKPNTKTLSGVLHCDDKAFIDLIERCLEWDPLKRITPLEALTHEWILQGLPQNVLQIHKKQYGIDVDTPMAHRVLRSKETGSPKSKPTIIVQNIKNIINAVPSTTTHKENKSLRTIFANKHMAENISFGVGINNKISPKSMQHLIGTLKK